MIDCQECEYPLKEVGETGEGWTVWQCVYCEQKYVLDKL